MRPGLFFLLAGVVVIADQVSKAAVVSRLALDERVAAVPGVLWLTRTHNTGGAFSLFPAGNSFFVVIAAVAIVALAWAYLRYHRHEMAVACALALALGGAVGNLIDRARYGWVVDFFDVDFIEWPVFNVADSAITVGILVLVGHIAYAALTSRPAERPADAARPETDTPADGPAA